MQIDKIDYVDKSNIKMPLAWNSTGKFEIEITDISNAGECKKAAEKAFEKAGASFELQGVNL